MKSFAALALVLLVSACGSGSGGDGEITPAEAVQETCEEVRAGIDQFNQQNYEGTVAHFQKAVKPAETYATVQPNPEAQALLEAVNYYAALAPEDYAQAATQSRNFARFKAVTLNQCAAGEPIDDLGATPT